MAIWDAYITDRDRDVYRVSGYGAKRGFGQRPAVLVIDVNYDFVGHERAPILESAQQWPNSCGEEGWDGVAAIARLLQGARAHSLPIFYTTTEAPRPDHLGQGMWRSSRHTEVAEVPGFVGSDIVREIAPQERDVVYRKSKPSAFFGTGLLAHLLELGVDTLLVTGTTTSGCVRASVLDAFNHNFNIAVVEEGCFDRGQASHAINLFDMDAKYADVVGLEQTLAYLETLPAEVFEGRIAPAAPATVTVPA